jgi:predicted TIM-barrel fold metal-dependent hydrolase
MDLGHVTAIDSHAHNLARPEVVARHPYSWAFTEGHDPAIIGDQARHTLFFRRSLRDVADLLDCAPTEEAVLACRDALGFDALVGRCFDAAGLQAVLMDDGFLPADTLPLQWHTRFVPVRRVLRLETLAEALLPVVRDFDDFEERFRAEIDPPAPPAVALKSIAAYRTGLEVRPAERGVVRQHFEALRRRAGGAVRLADKVLIDHLLVAALEVAARHSLPVQLHTGFGDPDLDLRLANPLHLRPILEDPRLRAAPTVLLHASYPFSREAGYLASVYPQVYLDTGLAVPMLSVAGMRGAVGGLLELAPASKLLYSSDAHLIPELYYVAAKWGRIVLGQVLEGAVRDGDLTAAEADGVAVGVLRDNARRLYRLGEGRQPS